MKESPLLISQPSLLFFSPALLFSRRCHSLMALLLGHQSFSVFSVFQLHLSHPSIDYIPPSMYVFDIVTYLTSQIENSPPSFRFLVLSYPNPLTTITVESIKIRMKL